MAWLPLGDATAGGRCAWGVLLLGFLFAIRIRNLRHAGPRVGGDEERDGLVIPEHASFDALGFRVVREKDDGDVEGPIM